MNATIPFLFVSTAATAFAPGSTAQELRRPAVTPVRPIDVSVEGLEARAAGGESRRPTGATLPFDCLESIADQAAGGCLTASSTPTFGTLLPYPGTGNVFDPLVNATVGGGSNNVASGAYGLTTVGGGSNNRAIGSGGTIGGGSDNVASGETFPIGLIVGHATVGGGSNNVASGAYGLTTVGGGSNNRATGSGGTIGGGSDNVASGETFPFGPIGGHATVGGGRNNVASGPGSTVGGGGSNTALGYYIGVRGYATVGGGLKNYAFGRVGTVGGGEENFAGGDAATVAGGFKNDADCAGATIGGGSQNYAGILATVGGGIGNSAEGEEATVAGGHYNSAYGWAAAVPGGRSNDAVGYCSFAAGRYAKANHRGTFVWGDSSSGDKRSSAADQFNVYASGGVRMFTNSAATTGVLLAAGGGSWSSVSDRASKENVEPVDARAVLERLSALPLATWNYKAQDDSIRHMGPMAQDFRAGFGLGVSDELIDTIDADGVALAAIQGLHELVREKGAVIEELRASNDAMRSRLERLEARVEAALAK